jgi:hypothetical protein
MTARVPTTCRLEYLTPRGWTVGHAGLALLDPQAYVDRLQAKAKFGRAVELSDDLQPTGKVWETEGAPDDPSVLVPTDTHIPALPGHGARCDLCAATDHKIPGECLL